MGVHAKMLYCMSFFSAFQKYVGLKHDSSRNSNILLVAFQRIDEVKKSVSIRIAVLLIFLKPKIHCKFRNIFV